MIKASIDSLVILYTSDSLIYKAHVTWLFDDLILVIQTGFSRI